MSRMFFSATEALHATLLAALASIHEETHLCDVKPTNCMSDRERQTVCLTAFGLCVEYSHLELQQSPARQRSSSRGESDRLDCPIERGRDPLVDASSEVSVLQVIRRAHSTRRDLCHHWDGQSQGCCKEAREEVGLPGSISPNTVGTQIPPLTR
jgi:serine/threonine protein kinase